MIERRAALPPVPGALDQIVQHFGTDIVAEVTGRSRRVVPRCNDDGTVRFAVENRPASAALHETDAFQNDTKPILVFSERSEEHTSELQSLMRISYAVFCLKKKNTRKNKSHAH